MRYHDSPLVNKKPRPASHDTSPDAAMYFRRLFFALFLCIPWHVYAWQTPAIDMMAQVPAVPVPDFKGKTYKEVQALAIDPRTKRSLFANITPIGPIDGFVATQSPEKGTPVYPGRSPLVVTLEPPKPSPLQNFLQQLATAAQNNNAKKPRPVPDLYGKTRSIAERMVRAANLVFEVNGDNNGTVTQQYPPAKTSVEPGTTVFITLGLPDSTVPGLYGMTVNQAAARLEQSSLRLGDVIGQQATTAIVQSQTVQPGTYLPRNSSVGVTVYSPPPPPPTTPTVPVPDLDKLTRDQAISGLATAGLQPGGISGPDAGLVQSQSPAANTPVDRGSSVGFVLAIPQVAVPNLNKSTRAEAIATLAAVGLKPGTIPGPGAGLVNGQSQSPPAGTQVDTGSLVSFSLMMPQVVVPTLLQEPQTEAEARLGVYGLVPAVTHTADWNPKAVHIVVAQQPDAGTVVDVGSSVAVIMGNAPPPPNWWDRLPFWKWPGALGTLSLLGWTCWKFFRKPQLPAINGHKQPNQQKQRSFPPPAVPTLASHPVSPHIDIGNNEEPRLSFKITLHDSADAASYTMSKEPTLTRKG
jgi:beta-lactam-binding protein with PASTA domain